MQSHDLRKLNQNLTLVNLIVSERLYKKKKIILKGTTMVTRGIIPNLAVNTDYTKFAFVSNFN